MTPENNNIYKDLVEVGDADIRKIVGDSIPVETDDIDKLTKCITDSISAVFFGSLGELVEPITKEFRVKSCATIKGNIFNKTTIVLELRNKRKTTSLPPIPMVTGSDGFVSFIPYAPSVLIQSPDYWSDDYINMSWFDGTWVDSMSDLVKVLILKILTHIAEETFYNN